MGVVYRARQKSLNRLVALKMLRAYDLDTAADVQRFRHEAEIVAELSHPHIVPIHEVGQHAGRHYFTIKLMEGGSLAHRIADYRLPILDWKTGKDEHGNVWTAAQIAKRQSQIANLMVSIARAVHHAHQRGILHRDLKPSNILLDADGRPHVTDFGLAKRVAVDNSLSQPGDKVGTPRYLAPEQAAGQRQAITTATDVYGLGTILYVLLTGQPPFGKETDLDILEQIRHREPERPSKINPRVDRDLETICLKCLEKEPQRRYGSAEGLAEDLERWVKGEAIEARAVSRMERMSRWCRRKPGMAGLAATLLLVLVAGCAGVVWQWARAESAYSAEAIQRQRAQRNFSKARQAVEDMYTQAAEKWLAYEPRMEPVRRAFLLKALKFYEELTKEDSADPVVQVDTAMAYKRMGDIHRLLGEFGEAEQAYRRALAIFEALATEFPKAPDYPRALASTLTNLGLLLKDSGRVKEAENAYGKALELYERLADDFTDPLYRHEQAKAYHNLAVLLAERDRSSEAQPAYRRAISLHEKLADDFPANPEYRQDLAKHYSALGNLLVELNRSKEAIEAYQQAITLQEKLISHPLPLPAYQQELAMSYSNLGSVLAVMGQLEEAEKSFRRAAETCENLASKFPTVPDYQSDLGRALGNWGHVLHDQGKLTLARSLMERAIGHLLAALQVNPKHVSYRKELGNVHFLLGKLLVGLGDYENAAKNAEEMPQTVDDDWQAYHLAAGILSHCVSLVEKDAKLSSSKRKELAQSYGLRAVDLLGQAINKGFEDPKRLETVPKAH